jgi:hypothetical protein
VASRECKAGINHLQIYGDRAANPSRPSFFARLSSPPAGHHRQGCPSVIRSESIWLVWRVALPLFQRPACLALVVCLERTTFVSRFGHESIGNNTWARKPAHTRGKRKVRNATQ